MVVYVATYVRVISPNYVESGLVNELPADGSIVLAVVVALLPVIWMPIAARRPSTVALWVLYLTGYLPSVLIPGFVLGRGWELVPLWAALGGSFTLVTVVVPRVRLNLPQIALAHRSYRWLLLGLALVGAAGVIMLFGIPSSLPGLDTVYDVRGDFSDALGRTGRIGGYLVWWTGAAIAPLLVAYGAWVRRPLMISGGFALFALVYGVAAFRSILFTALVVVGLLLAVRYAARRFGLLASLATISVIVVTVALAASQWLVPLSLGVRRLMVVPGQVISYYYEEFISGPHYLLSHSIFGTFITPPYDVSPPVLIGQKYYGPLGTHANGNLWADGLANFGLGGLVAASILLGLLLIMLDGAVRGKPLLVGVAIGGLSVWSMTNSGLLTAVMTHGIGLTMVLLWLLPSRAPVDTPRNRVGRVVHITTVHPSDDPRILLKECASLAEAGFDVYLVGRGTPPTHPPKGVSFITIGDASGRLARMATLPLRAAAKAWRLRADVIHIHDPELLPMAVLLRLSGRRVVYDAHEDLPRQIGYKDYIPRPLRPAVAAGAAAMEHLCVAAIDAVVAATPTIASRFPSKKTVTVQNFPLSSEFIDQHPTTYGDRPRLVAYVGRLTEAVGARVMAAAAARITQPDVRFVFGGPLDASLSRKLESSGGRVRVEYPGRLDRGQVVELLDDARVGLVIFQPVANYVEAWPTKLFEYMGRAVPVVASDFPLWRDIVLGADCGVVVDPTDPDAVARAIDRLIGDEQEAARMGGNGRQAVLEHYRWEDQATRLVGLYRRLIGGHGPSAH